MKYKHEQLIKDYIADTSQIVRFRSSKKKVWNTWKAEIFPHFDNASEWELLPAPKPDVVIEGHLGLFLERELCMYMTGHLSPNIRATFDNVTGELKSVEKI